MPAMQFAPKLESLNTASCTKIVHSMGQLNLGWLQITLSLLSTSAKETLW